MTARHAFHPPGEAGDRLDALGDGGQVNAVPQCGAGGGQAMFDLVVADQACTHGRGIVARLQQEDRFAGVLFENAGRDRIVMAQAVAERRTAKITQPAVADRIVGVQHRDPLALRHSQRQGDRPG